MTIEQMLTRQAELIDAAARTCKHCRTYHAPTPNSGLPEYFVHVFEHQEARCAAAIVQAEYFRLTNLIQLAALKSKKPGATG